MSPSTTIVTCYFNIKKLKDASQSVRPMSFYMNHGRKLLHLPYPMIIYCDEDTYDAIKQIRDEENPMNQTVYIRKNLVDYDFYKDTWEIIRKNRESISTYTDPQQRNTASHFLIGIFKAYCMYLSYQKNPFNTTHFAFIDFGCCHHVREFDTFAPKMIESPKDKIGILYIHYRPHKELEDMRTFLKYGGPCGMATTAYTIEGSYMYLFITRFMSLFYEGLSLGVGHADEQIMTYLFDRYPDMFTIHYGDYKSTFQNYHMIHDDYHAVRWFFIEQAYKNGKHELAKYAADNVLESIEKGTLQIPHEHIQFLEMLRELY